MSRHARGPPDEERDDERHGTVIGTPPTSATTSTSRPNARTPATPLTIEARSAPATLVAAVTRDAER